MEDAFRDSLFSSAILTASSREKDWLKPRVKVSNIKIRLIIVIFLSYPKRYASNGYIPLNTTIPKIQSPERVINTELVGLLYK